MSDFDSQIPVRSLAINNTTEIADSAGTTINPAKEDGNLASIKTDTDTLATGVSSGKYQENLAQVGGSAITLGQKTSANSVPVVIASDQSTVPINEAQVAGTATSVNTGTVDAGTQRVVLATNQPAVSENLTQVGGASVTLGQKTMVNSFPVVIASDQSAILVTLDDDVIVETPQYNTASAVAANASNTQTYSPGSTVHLDGVDASASGQMKIEIQYGTTGAETTKAVFFISKGSLQLKWRLPHPIAITNTMSVKVIRTNMDNQAMDVYSTILVH